MVNIASPMNPILWVDFFRCMFSGFIGESSVIFVKMLIDCFLHKAKVWSFSLQK